MITFVGAGPGAEDLITVRGLRLIKEADDRGIYKNLSNYDEDSFSMHR